MDTPNPYVIGACIVLVLATWAVTSTMLAFGFTRAIRLRDRRAARPRYRRRLAATTKESR